MSEPKLISPLLDGFTMGAPVSEHNGIVCYPAIKENSEKKYIVKVISIPPSQKQMDALLLAGAYRDAEGAMEYYKRTAEDILQEARFLKDISRLDGFLAYEDWQLEPITRHRLGYEVYLLGTYKRSFEKYVRRNPVTHREAMALAMDLCNALAVCRQAGYIYVDLKPGNIFISENKEYRIGDLGFIGLNTLKYTALPEKYHSSYSPPELSDPMESVNLSVDTYALGMILYQLYNEGKLPELSDAEDGQVPAPVNADYELSEIILKAIHPKADGRWLDPGDMGQAIVSYMQRNEIADTPITPYTPIDPEAQNVQIPRLDAPEPVQSSLEEDVSSPSADSEASVPIETEAEDLHPSKDIAEDTCASAPAEEAESADSNPSAETKQEDMISSDEETAEITSPSADSEKLSDDLSRIFEKADDLIAHETPGGVVIPEIPDAPDPFAFATEDSIEAEDLKTPFDPVMEEASSVAVKEKAKTGRRFLSPERARKARRFLRGVLTVALLTLVGGGGLWGYQNIYLQSVDSLSIETGRDHVLVRIDTDAEESMLQVTCSDNYGNVATSAVINGEASFSQLLPNTMYTIQVEIDGFHSLIGQTSEVFTTETTTAILSFSAVTGPEDGSAVLNFSVDGDEPEEWNVICSAAGEEPLTIPFTGHTVTIPGLTLGKEYVMTLDAGDDLSLSGKTSLTFLASRLILAEHLTVTTTDGTDMKIRWSTPGDTVVESWNVRCYNETDYDQSITVTDTEVYLTNIDSTVSYTVEVTAAGMTQPARSSITANPINITALNVDESDGQKLTVSWNYAGTEPEEGWLLLYSIDGNTNLNVIKCSGSNAVIEPKLPEANYSFTIQSVDGTSIFNNVHSYDCSPAPGYDAHGVKASDIQVMLLKTPEDISWSYEKIDSESFTETFALGDPISLVLYAEPDFYLPGETVKVLYVIRDAHGNVIPEYVFEADENWRDIWKTGSYHYGELDLPGIPESSGSYQLSIFLDGMFIAQTNFTIK